MCYTSRAGPLLPKAYYLILRKLILNTTRQILSLINYRLYVQFTTSDPLLLGVPIFPNTNI